VFCCLMWLIIVICTVTILVPIAIRDWLVVGWKELRNDIVSNVNEARDDIWKPLLRWMYGDNTGNTTLERVN